MKNSLIILKICAFMCMIWMTGCASETGWRFEIGVSPVKELNNNAGLKQNAPKREKY